MKTIRLNERQLRKIISEAVKKTLKEEMVWPFKDDEIWAQIEKEGGMSWSDGNGLELRIEEGTDRNGSTIYCVFDENGELEGYSIYLHKAQRYLHDAVARLLDGEKGSVETPEEDY